MCKALLVAVFFVGQDAAKLLFSALVSQGSEEDFCQPLGQAMAPPDASSALRQYYHTKVETLVYVCTSGSLENYWLAKVK